MDEKTSQNVDHTPVTRTSAMVPAYADLAVANQVGDEWVLSFLQSSIDVATIGEADVEGGLERSFQMKRMIVEAAKVRVSSSTLVMFAMNLIRDVIHADALNVDAAMTSITNWASEARQKSGEAGDA